MICYLLEPGRAEALILRGCPVTADRVGRFPSYFQRVGMAASVPRKKLIEVSIPLEAINVASARQKAIRKGIPPTLHL